MLPHKHKHNNDNNINLKPQATKNANIRDMILAIGLVSLSLLAELVESQCPVNTMTSFERIGGVTVKDSSQLTHLYSPPNSSAIVPITAECNNRCRRNPKCRAFLVNYGRHMCHSLEGPAEGSALGGGVVGVGGSQPTRVQLVATGERTAYFEKTCFSLPASECERAWWFERVLGHQLIGHDDKVLEDVPNRLRCQEFCMAEREFKCKSGEFDYVSMQCRLSASDRHSRPRHFATAGPSVDYFESQCSSLGGQTCESFERYDNLDLGRAEIVKPANSSDECQHICTHTIKAFACRSFTWSPATNKCYLNSANSAQVGGAQRLIPAPGLIYFERSDCDDLRLDCDHTAMTLNLRTSEPFRGRMYVRDEPAACETLGRSALSSSLVIPLNGASSQSSSGRSKCVQRDTNSRYSSLVVVQQHPLIQRKSDRHVRLVCDFRTSNKTVSSSFNVLASPWTSTALVNATSMAPQIKLRITDRLNRDVTGARLGDELFLNIEADSESVYDMVARSVVARSALSSEESITLIDQQGCPTDARIFPSLTKMGRRLIRARFDAFKFSSDAIVRFQVDVQFCLNTCPVVSCSGGAGSGALDDLNNSSSPYQSWGPDSYSLGALPGAAASSGGPSAAGVSSDSEGGLLSYSAGNNLQHRATAGGPPTPPAPEALLHSGVAPVQPTQRVPSHPSSSDSNATPSSNANTKPYSINHHSNSNMNTNSNLHNHNLNGQTNNMKPANAMDVNMVTPTTSDPQSFESRQMFASSNHAHSGHQSQFNSQLDQLAQSSMQHLSPSISQLDGRKLTRRRRSSEPLPAEPAHVPLQKDIIIVDSPAIDPSSAPATPSSLPGARQGLGAKSAQHGSRNRAQLGDAINSNTNNFQRLDLSSTNSRQPSYETLASRLASSSSSAGSSSNANEFVTDQDELTTSGELVCASKGSLLVVTIIFGMIQFLTVGLCLVSWFNRRHAHELRLAPARGPSQSHLRGPPLAGPKPASGSAMSSLSSLGGVRAFSSGNGRLL